ncbi:MAG: LexA family transcriptional regulator [Vicingaceae bacterium]
MSQFSENLKALRKNRGLTQSEMAQKLGLNRPQLGSYEEGRAEPKLEALQKMAHYFKLSLDQLVNDDLSDASGQKTDYKGSKLRILPIVTDAEDKEKVSLIPAKAAAGYLNGYADPEYLEQLPAFDLPLQELAPGTYRLFQIEGDSMEPIPSGSYILGQYQADWTQLKDGVACIVLSQSDGVVYKRVFNHLAEKELVKLHSDNSAYQPYEVKGEDLLEIWKAKGYLSFDLPVKQANQEMGQLSQALLQLKAEVEALKESKT